MSPDWSPIRQPVPYASLQDPQTLNIYAYVRNNPASNVDLDGHGWWQKFKNLFTDANCWCEGAEAEKSAAEFRARRDRINKPMTSQEKRELTEFVTVTILYNAADIVAGSAQDSMGEVVASNELATVGGRKPINSKYAGGTHPSGVEFSTRGFAVFGPHAVATVQIEGLTGNYGKDSALANLAAGLASTPDGYVWHHVEDTKTMELVPQDIHNTVRHTGGAAVIRNGGVDK